MERKTLSDNSTMIICNKQELKKLRASSLKHGDIVKVGKYYIYIRYGPHDEPRYSLPGLCSLVENENGKKIEPFFWPQFIGDFLGS